MSVDELLFEHEDASYPPNDASSVRRRAIAPVRHRQLALAGRTLTLSPVFDTYWRFASARQDVYFQRLANTTLPWTTDPILRRHRFTNAYRATDRVSQYLIDRVIYTGSQCPKDVTFRTLLFKFFNRIETWEVLRSNMSLDTWDDFDAVRCEAVLDSLKARQTCIYSAAYVIPPPQFGRRFKHANHIALLLKMMNDGLPTTLSQCRSLEEVYQALLSFPSVGEFLAYQFAIDLNYSNVVDFSEADFVVAGPGAKDGVRKCFGPNAYGIESDVIRWVADTQYDHFNRLGLSFRMIGERPLQLIDIQNLFCEVDKYARVAHPEVEGRSGRTRIKQTFRARREPIPTPIFPPKWRIPSSLFIG